MIRYRVLIGASSSQTELYDITLDKVVLIGEYKLVCHIKEILNRAGL